MGAKLLKLLNSKILILVLILALGLGLRLYKLGSIPPGLTWDEAALGYNAYSLSKTLKDEYGAFLPLTLKSFGDYKPALYAYLDIPFVMILGLNEWAVRLPSVLAGVGFILVCYLLVRHIFKDEGLSLTAAFFASISPLSIQFSRAGFESNVAVLLNVLGLYFFLKGLRSSKYFYLASMSLVLSMFCYQASKMYVPIILMGLFLFYHKLVKLEKNLVISILAVILTAIGVYTSTFLFGQSDRLATQNVFAYRRDQTQINLITKEDGLQSGSSEFEVLHGEWWAFTRGIFERYLVYFSPDTLFIEGDYSPRHSVPDLGILNYYAFILLPFGFYLLLRKKEQEKKIILFWLFTATVPAVLSRDLISMVRALNLMFPIAVLEGFGFYYLVIKLTNFTKLDKRAVFSVLSLAIAANLAFYLDFYFVHLPKESSEGWLYGYKQVFEQNKNFNKYDRVIFSDTYGQPYIYYLFYSKYPPEKFQSQAVLEQNTVDVGTVRKIDNIEFRPIYWPRDRGLTNTLFIGNEFSLPQQDIVNEKKAKNISEISFLDGLNAFKIVETGNEQ